MKLFAFVVVLAPVFFSSLVTAWDVHPDCNCNRRRELELTGNMSMEDEESSLPNLIATNSSVAASRRLRGTNQERNLQTFIFHIKMYWESGFCWQCEMRERKWCWKCRGSACGSGDTIEIYNCDEDSDIQKWVYKPASNGYGRISPASSQNLCFERQDENDWRLRTCDYSDDRQLVDGFTASGRFELSPAFYETNRCFTQAHDSTLR